MTRFILRRLVLALPVLFAASVIVFGIIRFAPGDPALMMISFEEYTDELADKMRHEMGLDQPVPVQYWIWLNRVVRGDLGRSLFTHDPVSELIANRLPVTMTLAFGTMLVASGISIPLGVMAAAYKDSWVDNLSRLLAIIGISMPVFWFGLIMLSIFALHLGWLPPGGSVERFGPSAALLPWITLGTSYSALLTRMVRSQMIEVLNQEYINTARAKGLTEWVLRYRHALKNAMLPVITVMGLEIGALLGGAVLTETVFDMPGLGRLLVDSLGRRDYPVIQGCILFITVIFVTTNLVVDAAYAFLDPRIKYD